MKQENDLFEYAVIRIVPRVEREEFLNAGVILYCKKQEFLGMKYTVNENRLLVLCPDCDPSEIRDYLESFEKVSKGGLYSGPIGQLPIAERFRWLTAIRSTVIQTSKVHPGYCDDASEKLESLFSQLVG